MTTTSSIGSVQPLKQGTTENRIAFSVPHGGSNAATKGVLKVTQGPDGTIIVSLEMQPSPHLPPSRNLAKSQPRFNQARIAPRKVDFPLFASRAD